MKKIKIGRSSYSDYHVNDQSVSREHAEITIENGTIVLIDLNSLNGTFILKDNERKQIKNITITPDDIIWFGKSGPHKVRDIIFLTKDGTEIVSKNIVNSNTYSLNRIRCKSCGSIIGAECSVCPECGRVI